MSGWIQATMQQNTVDSHCVSFISVFSLFSIVTFPNAGCASQDASRNGTCYTSSECQNKGGTTSGNCAAG